MKKYRNSQEVEAAKIVEVSGILQGPNGTTCVIRFDDGTSQQEDFVWYVQNYGAVGKYLVKNANGTREMLPADTFESNFTVKS